MKKLVISFKADVELKDKIITQASNVGQTVSEFLEVKIAQLEANQWATSTNNIETSFNSEMKLKEISILIDELKKEVTDNLILMNDEKALEIFNLINSLLKN